VKQLRNKVLALALARPAYYKLTLLLLRLGR